MPYRSDLNYNVTVVSAALTQSNGGTPGIALAFENDAEETIQHTIWLTAKTADRAREDLIKMGAESAKLASWAYLETLGSVLPGHECSIATFSEEYGGKPRVRVKWINEKRKFTGAPGQSTGAVSKQLARIFGATDTDDAPL